MLPAAERRRRNNGSPSEDRLSERMYIGTQKFVDRAEDRAERAERELNEERRAAAELKARLAALEARLDADVEGKKASVAQEATMVTMLMENSRQQVELMKLQLEQQRMEMTELRKQREEDARALQVQRDKEAEALALPYQQFAKDQAERAAREIAEADKRADRQMEMMKLQHDQSMTFMREQMAADREARAALATAEKELSKDRMSDLRDEIRRLSSEKNKSALDTILDAQKIVKAFKNVTGDDEDAGDIWQQLAGMIPDVAPVLPEVISRLGSAIQGIRFGVPIPSGPALPEQEEGPSEEEQRAQARAQSETDQLLDMIVNAYQQGVEPANLASSIMGTLGAGVAKQIARAPLNSTENQVGVVDYLASVRSELGSERARAYLRDVYLALKEALGS